MTTRELTVKEYAAAERVTPRTVRRWIDKGAIHVRRTPGGGLRVLIITLDRGHRTTNEDNRRHPSQ